MLLSTALSGNLLTSPEVKAVVYYEDCTNGGAPQVHAIETTYMDSRTFGYEYPVSIDTGVDALTFLVDEVHRESVYIVFKRDDGTELSFDPRVYMEDREA
jgi:hypothetical protein